MRIAPNSYANAVEWRGDPDRAPDLYRDNPAETVVLHPAARSAISHEVRYSRWDREWGGWLFQRVMTHDDTTIHRATGPGEDAVVGPASITFDVGALIDLERELRELGSDLIRVGNWHTHPGVDRDPTPSDEDIASWRAGLEILEGKIGKRTAAWTGLILTAERNCWSFPEFHAFVVRRDPNNTGQLICSRAGLKKL